ncbi:MAG: hypothetical protein IT372_02420 [Polyangiaceae bacterium]|nr:hypothetical protein [Polyangiaceae bacterium]
MASKRSVGPRNDRIVMRGARRALLVLLGLPAAGCAGEEHASAPPLAPAITALAGADREAAKGPLGLVSTQHAKLVAADGEPGEHLGAAVAISGDTAVIGAYWDDDLGTASGSAYVFVRSGADWVQQAKLLAGDGASSARFGHSVAISGDTIVVGAYGDDELAGWAGAAYVFVRTNGAWTQQAKLLASDGAYADQLGISVAVSGDTALVGADGDDEMGDHSGSAYVFVRSGAAWTQQTKLLAAEGQAVDWFGMHLALGGDTAVIGAPGDDDLGNHAGSAYVFARSGAVWTQQAKLLAGDGSAEDQLGISVAVSGDTALVGAYADDDLGSNAGSAYVFVRSGAAWTQQAKLLAGDGAAGDSFGGSVAISGDSALVGSGWDDHLGFNSGSAYVFTRSGAAWTQEAKLLAGDGAAEDQLGHSVALSGDTAAIGAWMDDDMGADSGSAYIFGALLSLNGVACGDGAECLSGFCVDGVCCDTACGGGGAGDCQACSAAAGAAVDGTCAALQSGTVCRAAAGVCDVEELCTGQSADCPADSLTAPGTECRPSAGECDTAEACDGVSASCPEDGHAPDGEPCAGGVCTEGTCEPGSGGAGGGGAGTGGAGGEAAGTGGDAGAGAADDPGEEGGCDCRSASASSPASASPGATAGMLLLALAAIRRARRRPGSSKAMRRSGGGARRRP